MTDIFKFIDKQIIYKRKMGYSLMEIYKYKQSVEPGEDDLLSLNHVVRVCHEEGLPFTLSQIRRVFNKVFKKEYHESSILGLNFLKQWKGNKLLKFESEMDVPFQKVLSGPIKSNQRSPVRRDNQNIVEILDGGKNE